jgi:hypothetical protein
MHASPRASMFKAAFSSLSRIAHPGCTGKPAVGTLQDLSPAPDYLPWNLRSWGSIGRRIGESLYKIQPGGLLIRRSVGEPVPEESQSLYASSCSVFGGSRVYLHFG